MVDDMPFNKIHQTYPKYDWNKNKGYPTKAHRLAISLHGKTEYHRKFI